MQDEKSFLRAIAEHPDDDPLRLVYGDWLEEHREVARAEFLRVWVEWHSLISGDPNAAPLRYVELRSRLRQLRPGTDHSWLAAVKDEGLVGDVVHARWGYNSARNTFCVIVRETPKTVVLAELPEKMTLNHDGCGQAGRETAVLSTQMLQPDQKKTFRASKHYGKDGDLAFYAKDKAFRFWDGQDKWFDSD